MAIESDLLDRIDYAKKQHEAANARMSEWEKLFKQEYDVGHDVADSNVHPYRSGKPRAILHKMLAMLQLRAKIQNQVVPIRDSAEEEAACTKLEKYLEGYQFRLRRDLGRNPFRDNVEWALLRGKGVLILNYFPSLAGSSKFPLRSFAPDPMTVFEVESSSGIEYFVWEHEEYVSSLKREFRRVAQDKKLNIDFAELKDTDKMTVSQYWDGKEMAVLVNDEVILEPVAHNYGFCPISVVRVNGMPFPEYEWRGQSVLADAMDSLKNQEMMVARMGDAVQFYFYPRVLITNAQGQVVVRDTFTPGTIETVPPGTQPIVLNPSPNVPLLERYEAMLQSDISLSTLPDIAWGMNANDGGKSGFAISQVLGQVMDRIQDMKDGIEVQVGEHFSQFLRLSAKASEWQGEKVGLEVYVQENGKRGRKLSRIGIGKDMIGDHNTVITSITPSLPTEKMAILQQANLLRQRDPVSKRPLMDDKSIRESFPEVFEDPDEINQRVDEEFYAQTTQEIQQYNQEKFLEHWRKDHPPIYDKENEGEGSMGQLMSMPKKELAQRLMMLQMAIKDPQALEQALAQQAQGAPQGMPPGQPPMMPPGGPGGAPMLPAGMMPPQMQSGNANPMQGTTPEELMMQQMMQAGQPPAL